jgi:hypothetical protein
MVSKSGGVARSTRFGWLALGQDLLWAIIPHLTYLLVGVVSFIDGFHQRDFFNSFIGRPRVARVTMATEN